jgi:hypothetical protein
MTPVEIRKRLLHYEELYPEFANAEDANEVAMVYGWGTAMTAYENYVNLRDLLEVSV